MRSFGVTTAAALAIAATSFFVGTVSAQTQVDPIIIKGSKFFYKTNGTQFFIKGVAYQQDYSGNGTTTDSTNDYTDPLADADGCRRDIPYLKQLQTNTIRVYAIDPTANHDDCMGQLADAGIYVVADLSAPADGQSINRDSPSWNDELYARYVSVVDAMQGYTNTLGFFGGNEVSNAPNNTEASAFVKAAVRDTKAYIVSKGYRSIGVGYATNDDADIRVNMADYFNCGDPTDAIDFWGYNIYSWCGQSSFQKSGYDVRTEEFSSYSVPVFFAEYGCNTPSPRQFTDVPTLFGEQMTPTWSGGIVYMYFQEDNDFGLVTVNGDSVQPNQDFQNLKSQIAKVSPSGVQADSYNPTNSPQACPSAGSDWAAENDPLPPTPNKELCACMYNSLSCVVSPNTDDTQYEDLFGTVCGYDQGRPCNGIAANASTGTYGAYGMCNDTEKLGFAFNQYYSLQSSSASACDFSGAAQTKAPAATAGSCSALIQQAGTDGSGTVTVAPSGTGAGAAGAGAASSSAGAGMVNAPGAESGILPVALIVTIGVVSGMGMIML